MTADRLVYYAFNDDPLRVDLALRSVRSLRKHNPRIPVELFVFGKLRKKEKADFLGQGASIRELPFPKDIDATYLKWFGLPHVNAERILYVDVDTYFFEDVARLFQKYRDKDFYARIELGGCEHLGYMQLGNTMILPRLNHGKMKALSRVLDFQIVPLFNTGVMLMTRRFAREMGKTTDQSVEFSRLRKFFLEKPKFSAAYFAYETEEMIASMLLGRLKKRVRGIRLGNFSKKDVPYYLEWTGRAVRSPGILMHYFSYSAPFFFRDIKDLQSVRSIRYPSPFSLKYLQP